MDFEYSLIFCTVPDQDSAVNISEKLVIAKLAACCNIVPDLTSIYHWENKVERENEMLLIIKTRLALFEEIEQMIRDIHPYSVPEIIAIPLIHGNSDYLNWIDKNVKE